MNILFYLSRFPGYGGIETVTEIVGCRLTEMGHQLSILTHVKQERSSVLMSKVVYYLMPDEGQWDTPRNRKYAVQVVNDNKFDVIIMQDSYAPFEKIAVLMKNNMGNNGRLLVFEHSTPLRMLIYYREQKNVSLLKKIYHQYYSLRKNRQRYLYLIKNADAYVVLAKGFIDELIEICGIKSIKPYIEKIHYINNPVAPDSSKTILSEKNNTILFVGQITQNKSVGTMLDIWKALSKEYKDWFFQIVGDGPLRAQLEERVVSEHIERVEFCGFQKPAEYYRKARIFWMASRFEGWPLTIVETMQRGCVPIVMDTFASVHDIIDSGRNGFIISADDIGEFTRATSELMEDNNIWNSFAADAMKKAEKFEINNIIKQWAFLLNSLSDHVIE